MEQFDQPAPAPNEEPYVQWQVVTDLEDRLEHGIREYGTGLQPFNGRNAPLDAYEESLDLAVYLKQMVIEREGIIAAFKEIAKAADIATAKLKAFELLVKMGEWNESGQAERDAESVAD